MTTTTTTRSQNDNSVLIALRELSSLESDRIEREQREASAKKAAEEARVLAEKQAAAARVLAEEQAKQQIALTLELETRARISAEAERDQRMAAMRAELAAIESERALLRAELITRGAPEPSRRGYGLAFGLSSVVAAALAGLLVMRAEAPRPVAVPSPSAPAVVAAPRSIEPAAEVVAAPAPPAAAPEAESPSAATRPHRHVRPRETTVEHHDLSTGLDFGDEDGLLPGEAHRLR
jgi:hypothetical protein